MYSPCLFMDYRKNPSYSFQEGVETSEQPASSPATYQVFSHADYPLLEYPNSIRNSIKGVGTFLENTYAGKRVIVMGTGTSGAMMMALLQHYMLNGGHDKVTLQFQIVRKVGDNGHHTFFIDNGTSPIFLIDDHIASGGTMLELAKRMKEEYGYHIVNRVEGIAAESAGNLMYRDILRYYPNLKYLLE